MGPHVRAHVPLPAVLGQVCLNQHGTEVRLTPRPSQGDSCGIGSSARPLTTRIEPRNTRHASPSGLGRNWRNLFPSLSPWFVNLDSEPCSTSIIGSVKPQSPAR